MTPTTSSAESETLSARNFVDSSSPAQRLTTSAPPPPAPPGRCTSSSTTLGRSAAICATAESTSAASPSTSTVSSRSARSPDRKIEWSSTMSTLVIRCLQVQVYFGADPARAGLHRGGAAGPGHPADDRLADAEPVIRKARQVYPRPAIPHEDVDRR